MTVVTLICVALLGLGSVNGAPAPDAQNKAKCIRRYGGLFTTSGFEPKNGTDLVFPPYYFNSKGEIAYDQKNPSGHPPIYADFQTCTPNYAKEPNPGPSTEGIAYGRFYVPSLKKCLAVTNPSGNPPYFLATAPCPSAADMATKKSIPFNFLTDEREDTFESRWIGGTIPSKKIYQGPDPPAKYCEGQYYVDATSPQGNNNEPYLGEPRTGASDDYRVHLLCPYSNAAHTEGTPHNAFLVPPYNRTGSS
ncbi:hypothetical protein FRC12_011550 [Ceratobasidium sp. 428]|nr:hypothetical protein FRC12_011550 [Ceratobasidium sp. 428]